METIDYPIRLVPVSNISNEEKEKALLTNQNAVITNLAKLLLQSKMSILQIEVLLK